MRGLLGVICPHAPVLIPGLRGQETEAAAEEIERALNGIDVSDRDLVVLVSPHARVRCVYGGAGGSLDGFGVRGMRVERKVDGAVTEALAERLRWALVDDELDHGAVVPFLLDWMPDVPVVVVGFAEDRRMGDVRADARALALALPEVAAGHSVVFVSSVNTSAGLTPRAPLTEVPGAAGAERGLLEALAGRGDIEEAAATLAEVGGSCALGPLTAWSALFPRAEILAHESPLGVGYLVAALGFLNH